MAAPIQFYAGQFLTIYASIIVYVVEIAASSTPTAYPSTKLPPLNSTFLCDDKDLPCDSLGGDCINCRFNANCAYGRNITTTCQPKDDVGARNFSRWYICRYCYQTPESFHNCTTNINCRVASAPREMYTANCTVSANVLCLGRRQFLKRRECDWTSGYRWSTAMLLSVTLGGFGVDRFYLGMWREGIGKLFSFGGLGVWTLVDVVLVGTGYVGPADGSLYLY